MGGGISRGGGEGEGNFHVYSPLEIIGCSAKEESRSI